MGSWSPGPALGTLLLAGFVACASPALPARALEKPIIAQPAPEPGSAIRTPSSAIARYWSFDHEPTKFFGFADLEGLLQTETVRLMGPALLAQLPANPLTFPCLRTLSSSLKEALVGYDDHAHFLMLVRHGPEFAFDLCKQGRQRIDIEGARAAVVSDSFVLAEGEGVFVWGTALMVESAFRGAVRSDLTIALQPGEFARFTIERGGSVPGRGRLEVTRERSRLIVEADGVTAQANEGLRRKLDDERATVASVSRGSRQDSYRLLLELVALTFDGGHLQASLPIEGSPKEQAATLTRIGEALRPYVIRYLNSPRHVEVRTVLPSIWSALNIWWNRSAGGSKRKLRSFGPVPAFVPKATTFEPTAQDWEAWRDLGFAEKRPQHFQYEIQAASDGESAEIIARGDLNGDGKTSLFKLRVKVDRSRDALVVEPMDEVDIDE